MTIRPVRPDEYETVGDLVVEVYRSVGGEPEWYLERLRDTGARASSVPVLVAVDDDGTIVGTITYVPGPGTPFSEVEREDEAGIRMLAVADVARGRGIGRALVQTVISRARAEGRRGIAFHTRPRMQAAHRLYESFGFRRDPRDDEELAPGDWLLGYRLRFDAGAGAATSAPRDAGVARYSG